MVMCLALSSCSQDEEIYSCDKEVNAWVKENLSDIQQMSRAEWLSLDENLKGPAFGAFTAIQKNVFWKEKMKEVQIFDWNEQEISHLNLLLEAIEQNFVWFDINNRTESDIEQLDIFAYKWIEYAEEELGWNKNLIGSIIASGNKLLDKNGTIMIKTTSTIRLKSSSEPACTCSTESDWCSLNAYCKNDGCTETHYCGTLLLYDCDGRCYF
jgi:hypothetical protein